MLLGWFEIFVVDNFGYLFLSTRITQASLKIASLSDKLLEDKQTSYCLEYKLM